MNKAPLVTHFIAASVVFVDFVLQHLHTVAQLLQCLALGAQLSCMALQSTVLDL